MEKRMIETSSLEDKKTNRSKNTIGKTTTTQLLAGVIREQKNFLTVEIDANSRLCVPGKTSMRPAQKTTARTSNAKFPNVKITTNSSLQDLLSPASLLKGIEKEFDKQKNPPTLVGDLVSNIRDLEKFIALLEEALVRARNPEGTVKSCMKFVQDGFAEILNPNLALEQELNALIENSTPPNDEFYALRSDKLETAVEFFYRVYKRFYDAKVLYSPQLRTLDLHLYTALSNSKAPDKPLLPSITKLNERAIKETSLAPKDLARLMRASYRLAA
jgi:hypothetical protein